MLGIHALAAFKRCFSKYLRYLLLNIGVKVKKSSSWVVEKLVDCEFLHELQNLLPKGVNIPQKIKKVYQSGCHIANKVGYVWERGTLSPMGSGTCKSRFCKRSPNIYCKGKICVQKKIWFFWSSGNFVFRSPIWANMAGLAKTWQQVKRRSSNEVDCLWNLEWLGRK